MLSLHKEMNMLSLHKEMNKTSFHKEMDKTTLRQRRGGLSPVPPKCVLYHSLTPSCSMFLTSIARGVPGTSTTINE